MQLWNEKINFMKSNLFNIKKECSNTAFKQIKKIDMLTIKEGAKKFTGRGQTSPLSKKLQMPVR